jgi:protein-disulfide isomerase
MKSYIWMGGLVIILVALMVWSVKSSSGISTQFELGVINPKDHIEGNASSTVIITEYSDFQCSACRSYYLVMRQMMAEFGDRVVLVYRYFPLSSIHANADFSARAAQAAGLQGKFWEMHDLLFEKQDEWAKSNNIEPIFTSYAKLIGISTEQFLIDFKSKEVKDFVNAQKENATKLGLQATPTFFINGIQIQNPNSTEAFREIINKALKSE